MILGILAAAFILSGLTANAYSIQNGQGAQDGPTMPSSMGGFSVSGLLAPFQNFIHSINSIGATSAPNLTGPSSNTRGAFQRFDDWLYGVAGFHISNFLNAFLNIFSWMLGVVKSGVDSLLKLL